MTATSEEAFLLSLSMNALYEDTPLGKQQASCALAGLLCLWKTKTASVHTHVHDSIAMLVQNIRQHPETEYTVLDMAKACSLSVRRFRDLFLSYTGFSPNRFVVQQRMRRAGELLQLTRLPIATIASMCGYKEQFYFSKAFHKHFGMTPMEYRRNGAG